jgi:excisionase family DNA binding protein
MNASNSLGENLEGRMLLTPKEAARALAISERTLWGLTKSQQIPRVQIGRSVRYHIDDLQRWIESHKRKRASGTEKT